MSCFQSAILDPSQLTDGKSKSYPFLKILVVFHSHPIVEDLLLVHLRALGAFFNLFVSLVPLAPTQRPSPFCDYLYIDWQHRSRRLMPTTTVSSRYRTPTSRPMLTTMRQGKLSRSVKSIHQAKQTTLSLRQERRHHPTSNHARRRRGTRPPRSSGHPCGRCTA